MAHKCEEEEGYIMDEEITIVVELESPIAFDAVAVDILTKIITEQKFQPNTRLVVEVAGVGCGGFMYNVFFAEVEADEETVLFSSGGLECATDTASYDLLKGTVIKGDVKGNLSFNNPNSIPTCASSNCGGCCGGETEV